MLPALNGLALIARRAGTLTLPVGIFSAVIFGKPFQLPSNNGKLTREEASQIIMERISDLPPTEYHGFYAKNEK